MAFGGSNGSCSHLHAFLQSMHRHPFDKDGEKTDDDIEECIVKVGSDEDKDLKLMDELVFDERLEGLSDSCIELMRQLMHPDPLERMTSEKFLRHPWIQGLTASWTTMGKAHGELKAFWQHKFRAEVLKKFAASIGRSGEKLSDDVVAEMFDRLDLKKTGVLELDEIWTTFHDLGVSDKNIRTIFASADLDGTGVIHYDEFRTLLTSKYAEGGPGLDVDYLQQRFKAHILGKLEDGAEKNQALSDQNKLREVFNVIDMEGNGVLDPHEIRVFLRSAGEPEDVISRIVASLDLNRDGGVSWQEFLDVMGAKGE
jgi:Ca2+-binding EF-hand superfamily protein